MSTPPIQTENFTLSVLAMGDPHAPKLALILPGRLETKDYAHIQSHLRYLATQGYYAVSFDPPGSWDSPGGIETYTVTNYLQAVHELIAFYGSKPTVLIGHSLGGSVAILAAADNSLVTHLVLLMTAVGEPQEDIEWKTDGQASFSRDLPPGDGPTTDRKQYVLPYSYLEDSYRYDRVAALQRCTQPKLFIAGAYDVQATPDEVQETLRIAPDPKKFVQLPCAHSYRYDPQMIQMVEQEIGTFLH